MLPMSLDDDWSDSAESWESECEECEVEEEEKEDNDITEEDVYEILGKPMEGVGAVSIFTFWTELTSYIHTYFFLFNKCYFHFSILSCFLSLLDIKNNERKFNWLKKLSEHC